MTPLARPRMPSVPKYLRVMCSVQNESSNSIRPRSIAGIGHSGYEAAGRAAARRRRRHVPRQGRRPRPLGGLRPGHARAGGGAAAAAGRPADAPRAAASSASTTTRSSSCPRGRSAASRPRCAGGASSSPWTCCPWPRRRAGSSASAPGCCARPACRRARGIAAIPRRARPAAERERRRRAVPAPGAGARDDGAARASRAFPPRALTLEVTEATVLSETRDRAGELRGARGAGRRRGAGPLRLRRRLAARAAPLRAARGEARLGDGGDPRRRRRGGEPGARDRAARIGASACPWAPAASRPPCRRRRCARWAAPSARACCSPMRWMRAAPRRCWPRPPPGARRAAAATARRQAALKRVC